MNECAGAMGQPISAALPGDRAAMYEGPALAAVGHRGSIEWGYLIHRRTIDSNAINDCTRPTGPTRSLAAVRLLPRRDQTLTDRRQGP
jgi:hypothetical protein